jgi:hypothetical protein
MQRGCYLWRSRFVIGKGFGYIGYNRVSIYTKVDRQRLKRSQGSRWALRRREKH